MNSSVTSQIRANNLKVYLWIGLLTAFIGVLGSLISYYFDWGLTGTGAFLLVAGIVNLIAYYYSDTLVLRVAGAKPLHQDHVPELFELVNRLCAKAQIPVPRLFLLPDSTMNAFATGRDYNHSAVAVSRGLLERMTLDEVEAVVAHELAHIRNFDMRLMAVVSILASFVSIVADMYWTSQISGKLEEKDRSGVIALVGVLLAILAPLSAFLIQMAISRRREFVADAGSVEISGKPLALISALKKISMDIRLPASMSVSTSHLYFSSPAKDSFIEKLFSTHPPLDERIHALERMR